MISIVGTKRLSKILKVCSYIDVLESVIPNLWYAEIILVMAENKKKRS
jgi:hypothetical protein